MSDSTDIPALIYDRYTVPRRFDSINNILRPFGLALSLLIAEKCQFGAAGASGLTPFG